MRGEIRIAAFIVGSVSGVLIGRAALAASFDCAASASPRERLICSDPTLSDLDGRVGGLYQERKALLSSKGADQLQVSERSWLHYIGIVCPPSVPEEIILKDSDRAPLACLTAAYKERLEQLQFVGRKVGPFLLTRVDLFAAKPSPDDYKEFLPGWPDDNRPIPDYDKAHAAYPQVDAPLTREAVAWNKRYVRVLQTNEIGCNTDTDYLVTYSNDRMLGLQLFDSEYCHGTAHANGDDEVVNFVLPKFRVLEARDVFGTTDGWKKRLQTWFFDAYENNGWDSRDDGNVADFKRNVIEPRRWSFSAEGLHMFFNGDGDCMYCSGPDVTMPWADLKPLLARDSVVP